MDVLALGLIAGVFEAIPYQGPIMRAVPARLFALIRGGMSPFWVSLAYLAVQVLENKVISPLVFAHSMKLDSMAGIFSILIAQQWPPDEPVIEICF
ncbi:MAG: AI-2E family transporter [Geobacteraceae bacterium]|nr:MAG: AI-2E family transporter [Geobacteraceae bacterium]RPI72118.1 MAG: AI-2E family transporter [Geobacteraceae bacterium]RPI73338.1 MAG: AI-2E family transporter [Geobacteraceae bacterium]